MARVIQGGAVLVAGVLLIAFRRQLSDLNADWARAWGISLDPTLRRVQRGMTLFIGVVLGLLGLAILLGVVAPN